MAAGGGRLTSTYHNNLKAMNVMKQAFASCEFFFLLMWTCLFVLSGTFTGNHMHRVLERSTELFNFLLEDNNPALRDLGIRYLTTFEALGKLQSMTKSEVIQDKAKFLRDWATACDNFFQLHQQHFSFRITTPKMHILKGTVDFLYMRLRHCNMPTFLAFCSARC